MSLVAAIFMGFGVGFAVGIYIDKRHFDEVVAIAKEGQALAQEALNQRDEAIAKLASLAPDPTHSDKGGEG